MDDLKAKIEALPESDLRLRLTRAESWLRRGDAESDADAKYIFLWIAFNAAYAVKSDDRSERDIHRNYFKDLIRLEGRGQIYDLLSTDLLTPPVLNIMNNFYVFQGFWDNLPEPPINWQDWPTKKQFEGDRAYVENRLPNKHTPGSQRLQLRPNTVITDEDVEGILCRLFDRLYVLRNQLMHGCATQDGTLNRRQVDAGAAVLRPLVYAFRCIMVDHPSEDWGGLSYPVRKDIREDRRQ